MMSSSIPSLCCRTYEVTHCSLLSQFTVRSNQKLKQRFRSALMALLEMVVTRPGLPSRAFAHRNEAGYDMTDLSQ